ncbi:LOW QUALITY PROTEIN: hypothetical protein PHMEG_0006238 [Phytophthora megakarya]|uniref:DDE Tnp4 domain-containing protein n=1 Tax=Phytophthora megakarya TaxID=4795 RepID=A0A225WPA1_9STRA|nr:LOW QUALITY PROTEIN: hypothetical protein PHMEG_0006238 [Phytophthora megakarya]
MFELPDGFAEISKGNILTGSVECNDRWLCEIRAPSSNEVPDVTSFFSGHYHRYGVNLSVTRCRASQAIAFTRRGMEAKQRHHGATRWSLHFIGDNAYPLSNSLLVPFNKLKIKSKPHSDYNFF